jgi:hypothetical protein
MKRLPSGKERAALVNEWVRLELIPCQPRQIRSYLHKLRTEPGYEAPERWGKVGKPSIASDAALKVIFDTNVQHIGQTVGSEEIKKGLIELKIAKLASQNIAFDQNTVTVDPKTVKIYKATMALESYSSTTTSTIAKTKRRFKAMNSVRNAMSFAATVLSTHFIVGAPPKEAPVPDSMTSGGRKALNAASELFGGLPVYPILSELSLSTDDITLFVCDTVQNNGPVEWRLASPDDQEHKVTTALYKNVESDGHLNGLRVKFTVTKNAAGAMAQIFISVNGLSEKEMPQDDNNLLLTIPRMSPGAAKDVHNEVEWFIYFQRMNDSGKIDSR